jgi:hypothetical protein
LPMSTCREDVLMRMNVPSCAMDQLNLKCQRIIIPHASHNHSAMYLPSMSLYSRSRVACCPLYANPSKMRYTMFMETQNCRIELGY